MCASIFKVFFFANPSIFKGKSPNNLIENSFIQEPNSGSLEQFVIWWKIFRDFTINKKKLLIYKQFFLTKLIYKILFNTKQLKYK